MNITLLDMLSSADPSATKLLTDFSTRAEFKQVFDAFQSSYDNMSNQLIASKQIGEAPKWLIFKDMIINTAQINVIKLDIIKNEIVIEVNNKNIYYIPYKDDINDTWRKLQHVFTYGANIDDNKLVE